MLCPKCGKELEEEQTVCPSCGAVIEASEPADEEPAEETTELDDVLSENTENAEKPEADEGFNENGEYEVTLDDQDAEAEEEPEEEKPAKKSQAGKIIGFLAVVIIALLIVIIVFLGMLLKQTSDGTTSPFASLFSHEVKYKGSNDAVEITDADGKELETLTNAEFSFYYWGEVYYFLNYYGSSYFDATQDLDDQVCTTTTNDDGTTEDVTWQDYFVDQAEASIQQVYALVTEGEAAGFEMSEEYESEYQNVVDTLADSAVSAGFTNEDGTGNSLAYIQDSYGPDATVEYFEEYLHDSYYASAYSEEIYNSSTYTDDQISAYYDENADTLSSSGIVKSDMPNINVRHILIQPEETTEDSEESSAVEDSAAEEQAEEDADAAAEAKAEEILQEWKDGEATEDSFADLANEYSSDGGSNTTGGLYEDVYPGEMVTEFNDWCFDESRQPGDTDIVKTDYGYHIMYFVGTTDEYYWKTQTEEQMRTDDYNTAIEELIAKYPIVSCKKLAMTIPDAIAEMNSAS